MKRSSRSNQSMSEFILSRCRSLSCEVIDTSRILPETFEYYIQSITEEILVPHSNLLPLLVHSFRCFVKNQYILSRATNNEANFRNTLFQVVSISRRTTNAYLILVASILELNIGDKITLANRVSSNLLKMQSDVDKSNWKYLSFILNWINNVLKDAMQPVIYGLRKLALQWVDSNNSENCAAGFKVLSILVSNFPLSFRRNQLKVHKILTKGLQQKNDFVAKNALGLLKNLLKISNKLPNFDLENFCGSIMKPILNGENVEYFIRASELIYKNEPSMRKYLALKISPEGYLKSKDNTTKITGLRILPFTIGGMESIKSILSLFKSLIGKNSSIRNVSFLSLGKILFQRNGNFSSSEKDILESILKKVVKYIDNENAMFSYIAIITAHSQNTFKKDISFIFTKPLTKIAIKGIKQYNIIFKERSNYLLNECVKFFNRDLLEFEPSPQSITFRFYAFKKLGVDYAFFTPQIVLNYSRFLNSNDYYAKKSTSYFISSYQKNQPNVDILSKLLNFISYELNNKIRIKIFSELRVDPKSDKIVPLLSSLLYDSLFEIREKAFNVLIEMVLLPNTCKIISCFLNEKIDEMKINKVISREHLKYFLILCSSIDEDNIETSNMKKQILLPYIDFLLNYIIEYESLNPPIISMELLHYIIIIFNKYPSLDKLINFIKSSLANHSSYHRLNAVIDLLDVLLTHSNFLSLLFDKYSFILVKLLDITKLDHTHVNQKKLIHLLSNIGAVKPTIIHNLANKVLKSDRTTNLISPLSFISMSKLTDPSEALLFASNGIVLSTLLDIMINPSLFSLFSSSLEALLIILRRNRTIGESFQSLLLSSFEEILHSNSESNIYSLLSSFPTIIAILGKNFAPSALTTINFICDKWFVYDKITLLRIIEWIKISTPESLRPHVLRISSVFLSDIMSAPFTIVESVFSTFVSLGIYNQIIAKIIIPDILKWINNHALDTEQCIQILPKLEGIIRNGYCEPFSPQIICTMIKIVNVNKSLHDNALNVLYYAAIIMGVPFLLLLPKIEQIFTLNNKPEFLNIIKCYQTNNSLSQNIKDFSLSDVKKRVSTMVPSSVIYDNSINIVTPLEDWTGNEWELWWSDLSLELLVKSQSRAISVCKDIAQKYSLIKDSLFPVAFALMYTKTQTKSQCNSILDVIFKSKTTPKNILRCFLSVIELFEVLSINYPIDPMIIARKAMEVNMLAQALRIYEQNFNDKNAQTLLYINLQLGLPLAACGIIKCTKELTLAQQYEKLGLWEEALKEYANNHQENKEGLFNCLHALSRYSKLKMVANDNNYYAASAAWHLFEHSKFLKIASSLNDEEKNYFFIVIKNVMQNNFQSALQMIKKIRELASPKIFPTIGQDYEHLYNEFAKICLLSEVEDVICYKEFVKNGENSNVEKIRKKWDIHFSNLPMIPEIIHSHICVRSLVLSVHEQRESFTKLISSSLDKNLLELSDNIIHYCIKNDNCIEYQFLKCQYLWKIGKTSKAISKLSNIVNENNDEKFIYLLAKWYYTKGSLQQARESMELINSENIEFCYQWATINFSLYQSQKDIIYLKSSLIGYIKTLQKDPTNLISSLRILHILFYCEDEIFDLFESNYKSLSVSSWMRVLTIIISRYASRNDKLRKVIDNLIIHIGKTYPNPILHQLLVLRTIGSDDKKQIVEGFFQRFSILFPDILTSFLQVTNEYIRIAVSWWETCVTEIDEASRAYSIRIDYDEMCSILFELYDKVTQPPTSFHEKLFVHEYGQEISEANEYLREFQAKKNPEVLQVAWHHYINIFYSIKQIIKELNSFKLKDASPYLANLPNKTIFVPGTSGDATNPPVLIQYFEQDISIMKSKQRPRKLVVHGKNGEKIKFLLKAHEDTRLDERIMKLFLFINTIIRDSSVTPRNDLTITTYSVIPLSPQVGLIGWVPDCSTIYNMLKDYREKNKINLESEAALVYSNKNYEKLPKAEKVKAFLRGFTTTKGDDLQKLILNSSSDSMNWIERRNTYSLSLALMSMVGYILGIGDRHLCNIMMNNDTSKIIHIDFGDCFEVAQSREIYPELVPFRLTRLLVNALEVSKIEGTFRSSCENVLKILRSNDEQIIGLLSEFIYNPLQQWNDNYSEESPTAIKIINRIKDKLNGNDFQNEKNISIENQVNNLIVQATDPNNLCEMYRGWYPWW